MVLNRHEVQQMQLPQKAHPYFSLLQQYLDGQINMAQFQTQYFQVFKNDPNPAALEKELYKPIEDVFYTLEDYDEAPQSGIEGIEYIDEPTARKRCLQAYETLRTLLGIK